MKSERTTKQKLHRISENYILGVTLDYLFFRFSKSIVNSMNKAAINIGFSLNPRSRTLTPAATRADLGIRRKMTIVMFFA